MPKNIIKGPSKAAKKAKSARKKRSPARCSSGAKMSRDDEVLAKVKQAHDIGYTHPSAKLIQYIAKANDMEKKSFSNIISRLKTRGVIMYHSGEDGEKGIILSPKGMQVVGVPSPPENNDAAQARIKGILTRKQVEIFDALAGRGTHLYEFNELRDRVCPNNQSEKSFGNLVSRMKATCKVVEYEDRTDATGTTRKYLRLTSLAFPFPETGAAATATSHDGLSMDTAIPIDD